jgi:hypothetical protein
MIPKTIRCRPATAPRKNTNEDYFEFLGLISVSHKISDVVRTANEANFRANFDFSKVGNDSRSFFLVGVYQFSGFCVVS